jgi:hypothetical protein
MIAFQDITPCLITERDRVLRGPCDIEKEDCCEDTAAMTSRDWSLDAVAIMYERRKGRGKAGDRDRKWPR